MLAEKSGEGNFRTTGLLMLLGRALAIVVVGRANYVVVFNYADEMDGPYGTLQDKHFQALERFWNNVVQNSSVVHGGVKAEAALVLPANYGGGRGI